MQHRFQIIKNGLPALLVLLWSCRGNSKEHSVVNNTEPSFKVYTVQQDYPTKAWGYIIEHNQKLFIKQFAIPAIPGDQLFKNREQAEKLGALVAYKLNHSLRPTVTRLDLDSLGIIPTNHVIQEQ